MSRHVTLLNPPRGASEVLSGCGQYWDAPICTIAELDVTCYFEIYRGCLGSSGDCADDPTNPDDRCCAATLPVVGDNIDHRYCSTNDASYGGLCGLWNPQIKNPCDDTR